jgi:hypothetical protein
MWTNIYSTPEAFGLKVVFDVDKSSGSYEFDTFVIWKGEDRYYWADSAGCSCPVPFEDVNLSNAAQGTLRDAINDARAWVKPDAEDSWNIEYARAAQKRIEEFASESGVE